MTKRVFVNAGKSICFWIGVGFIIMAASNAPASTVSYTLENVILDDNDALMAGTFSWTFDVGDFENGVGVFTFLDIPFTSILGFKPPNRPKKTPRRLNGKNPKNREKCNKLTKKGFSRANKALPRMR